MKTFQIFKGTAITKIINKTTSMLFRKFWKIALGIPDKTLKKWQKQMPEMFFFFYLIDLQRIFPLPKSMQHFC